MKPASRSSDSRACSTVGEISSQALRRARDVSVCVRNSQSIRKVQRRPNRSSSTMIGRPVREPRTAAFFTPDTRFGIDLPHCPFLRIISLVPPFFYPRTPPLLLLTCLFHP